MRNDQDSRLVPQNKYPNRPPSETNPYNQPTGHYTGRCKKCGSDDLWDDNLTYGCNNCGAIYFGG